MNDAVDRLIVEREAMDRGLSGGVAVSIALHLLLVGASFVAPLLRAHEPLLKVQDGFTVALPPGGGGTPNPDPPAPVAGTAPAPETAPPQVKPPDVIKPPKPEKLEPKKKGLPDPSEKKTTRKKRPEKEEPPATAYDPSKDPTPRRQQSGAAGGSGTSTQTPGLEFAPPGPGVPGGTDWLGDWYLASVQKKIWTIWMQQIRADFKQAVSVRFTIESDGSVSNVQIVQSSEAPLLDLAAQRAVYSAGPFGPLPKNYGTNRVTVQANFKPN